MKTSGQLKTTEQRRFRRLCLRLPITNLECPVQLLPAEGFWTTDISSGGMHFHANCDQPLKIGAEMSFEISVPPGEGYSLATGTIRGSGRVVRVKTTNEKKIGIAVKFTDALMLEF